MPGAGGHWAPPFGIPHQASTTREPIAATLNWWIGRSSFTHRRLEKLSNWTMGERNCLSSTQISHLRNVAVREPNYLNLDAISVVNRAVWTWQTKGQRPCVEQWGPYSSHGVDPAWLDEAAWLSHPDEPTSPLDYGDWAEIVAGYLELPYLDAVNLSPSEAQDLSSSFLSFF